MPKLDKKSTDSRFRRYYEYKEHSDHLKEMISIAKKGKCQSMQDWAAQLHLQLVSTDAKKEKKYNECSCLAFRNLF